MKMNIPVIAIAGLIGPLIYFGSSKLGYMESTHNLVTLLWVTGFLGVLEYSLGEVVALGVAVAMNVLVFSCVYLLIGKQPKIWRSAVSYIVVISFLSGYGYALNGFRPLSLFIAAGIWLVLIFVTHIQKRIPRKP